MTTLRTALPVRALGCGGADRLTVERILIHSRGVLTAFVNPVTEMAYVEFDPALTDLETLGGILETAGYCPRARVAVRRGRPPGRGERFGQSR